MHFFLQKVKIKCLSFWILSVKFVFFLNYLSHCIIILMTNSSFKFVSENSKILFLKVVIHMNNSNLHRKYKYWKKSYFIQWIISILSHFEDIDIKKIYKNIFIFVWDWGQKGERLGGEGREFENLKVCLGKEERESMDFGARQKTIEFGSAA